MAEPRQVPWGRIVLVVVLVAFHAWALSRPWLHQADPLFDWRKGPLVNEASPYSSYHAARYLWPVLAGMLDAWILAAWAFVRWGRPHPRLRRLEPLVGLLMLGVVLAAGEGATRLAVRMTHFTQYHPDPDLYWWNRPNLRDLVDQTDHAPKSTESHGFRGREEVGPDVDPRELRVFVVGDSSTFGLGVRDDETYSAVMERELSRRLRQRVRVVNMGSPGHSSYQGWILWQRHGEALGADVLVWAYNNDSCLDMVSDRDRMAGRPGARAVERVLFKSDLFLMARQVVLDSVHSANRERFRQTYPSAEEGWVRRVSFEDYQQYLEDFDSSASSIGRGAVFVRMPLNRSMVAEKPIYATSYDDAYRDWLTDEFCAEPGRLCLDMERRFGDDRSLFLPGHLFHPNPSGHRIIGEALADVVMRLLHTPAPPAQPGGGRGVPR